ncbi:hypothetical protein CJ179_39110 [Rhodococcus sp. ACS1]|nr:hypothetical protein CJ179_39110 [Rhodococcus sp. ACS1]
MRFQLVPQRDRKAVQIGKQARIMDVPVIQRTHCFVPHVMIKNELNKRVGPAGSVYYEFGRLIQNSWNHESSYLRDQSTI